MSYSIAESYTLPSGGRVYPEAINPDIKIRSMTTLEEMKRLSRSDRPYKNMSEIIDDCLIEGPGISAYDLCIGDYQFLLHKLRIVTYGPDYELASTCPACGSLSTGVVNLEHLAVLEYSDEVLKYQSAKLPKSGKVVEINFQTPRTLDDVSIMAKDMNRKSRTSGDFSLLLSLQAMIKSVDGVKLDPLKQEDFVSALDMMDASTIIQYSQKLNNAIGLSTELVSECESCGLTYNNTFRITTEFFGPRIHI